MKTIPSAAALLCVVWNLHSPVKADLIADWQFQSAKPGSLSWVDVIGHSTLEGNPSSVSVGDGVLRVRRSMPGTEAIYASLPETAASNTQSLWLMIELAGWHFAGKPGEYVSFGFADKRDDSALALSPQEWVSDVVAEMRLLRTRTDRANINGRAFGVMGATNGLASGPGLRVPLEEKQTTWIALRYDTATHTYTVLLKRSAAGNWQLAGQGATDAQKRPRFLRLAFSHVMNDTADEGVNIRRISVGDTTPAGINSNVLSDLPFITAPQWAVMNADTGKIMAGRGIDTPAKIASITKVMTCYVICKLAEKNPAVLKEIITCTAASEATRGSSSALPEGDSLPVLDALYALMLPSGNDMGVLLAEHFSSRFAPADSASSSSGNIRASYANFIAEMNRQAKALGMNDSIFRHPFSDGGATSDRTASPRDLLRLADVAMKLPLFARVAGTELHQASVKKADGSSRIMEWHNSNHLLGHLGVNGIKTGTDVQAKACLLSSCEMKNDGGRYYAVVLGGESYGRRYIDTRNIFEWAAKHKNTSALTLPVMQSSGASTTSSETESEDN